MCVANLHTICYNQANSWKDLNIMSSPYSSSDFLKALQKKCPSPQRCPFCGNSSFSAAEEMVALQVQTSYEEIHIGTSIPCGIVLCLNCGHVNLFALGALGLIPKKGNNNDAVK